VFVQSSLLREREFLDCRRNAFQALTLTARAYIRCRARLGAASGSQFCNIHVSNRFSILTLVPDSAGLRSTVRHKARFLEFLLESLQILPETFFLSKRDSDE